MISKPPSPSAPVPHSFYPPDLVKVISHMPAGLRAGPALILEGLRASEAVAGAAKDLQHSGAIVVADKKTGRVRLPCCQRRP